MAKHFTKREIDEIEQALIERSKKDSSLPQTDNLSGGELLPIIQNGENKTVSYSILDEKVSETATSVAEEILDSKVDKIPGKNLSTNDYTDADKQKVADSYQKPSTGIPASDIAEGVIPDVSQFVTRSVNDLINYYLKSEVYTQRQVDSLIETVSKLSYVVADVLPSASADTMYKIYLIPSSNPKLENVKDEFFTIRTESQGEYIYYWEQFGSTSIDLDDYITTEELNSALASYTTTANLTELLSQKQDVISDLSSIRSGAAAGSTAYQKPSSGIPKSDLTGTVQTSLDKADSSLQFTPSGEVDPQITPADYATRDELNQLGQQVIYDVTKNNPTAGPNNDGKFESLSALLSDANLSTLIPIAVRCGGMSIRFVQTFDNKYVQYRLMKNEWSINIKDWFIDYAYIDGIPVGSPLSYNSIIYDKYPRYNGIMTSLNGIKSYVYDVSNVQYLMIKWGNNATNTNFGVLFSNDATFTTVESFIAPYTQTQGRVIIKVPNGVSYVVGLEGTLTVVDGDYIGKVTNDLYAEFKRIESDFNSYTPLTFSGRIQGYLKTSGSIAGNSSWAINLYAVTRGQHIFFKQTDITSPYAYYGLCDDLSASHILSCVASNYGDLVEVIIPDGVNYFMVNAATETTADYPSTIQCLGFPKLDLTKFAQKYQSVYNYFPAYSLNKDNIGYLNGIARYAADNIVVDNRFISVGQSRSIFLEMTTQRDICNIPASNLRNVFKNSGKIRVSFDIVCTDNKSIRVRLWTWGGSPSYYDKTFACGTDIRHFDYIFEIPTSQINNITSIDLFIYRESGGAYNVNVSNVIVTDDIFNETPIPYFSQDWTPLVKPTSPYIYKECIYFGDSISTGNNYKWKGLMWDIYRVSYLPTGSGLNPAEGGITVRPDADGYTPNTNKYSIWYRCSGAKFADKTFDFINLFGGQNDKGIDASLLGAITDKPYVDDASTFDTPSDYTDVWADSLTFAQCYMGCIEMLQRDYPNKEIMLMTVYPTRDDTPVAESMAILQVQIAKKYGLKITPLWWNIFDSNAVEAFTLDGTHPSDVLARQICIRFSQTLGI